MTISLSDKAQALSALHAELQVVEDLQLKVGEDIANLFLDQVRLAERIRSIYVAMEKIITC